jgi:alpha-mannosidase
MMDGGHHVVWSSLDSPIAGFGGDWPGYVSPAHRCYVAGDVDHPPLKQSDLDQGWIVSHLFYHNFGTNFAVSQVDNVLFRYVFTTRTGGIDDATCAGIGSGAMTPVNYVYTRRKIEQEHRGLRRQLPNRDTFWSVSGEGLELIACRRSQDGRGVIFRLWNVTSKHLRAQCRLTHLKPEAILVCNPTEDETGEQVTVNNGNGSFLVDVQPGAFVTLKAIVPLQ